MPTYTVIPEDESTWPTYRWDEEIVSTEVFPIFDNRVHSPEQSEGLLVHTRIRVKTRYTQPNYTAGDGTIYGPMTLNAYTKQMNDAKSVVSSYHKTHSRSVASAPRSSPKRGTKKTVSKSKKKSRSTYPKCPPGYRYDFRRRMCVKIRRK